MRGNRPDDRRREFTFQLAAHRALVVSEPLGHFDERARLAELRAQRLDSRVENLAPVSPQPLFSPVVLQPPLASCR